MGSGSVCPWASCTSLAPPLRLDLLDSSFINSLSGCSLWPPHLCSCCFFCLHVLSSFPASLAFICLPISLDSQDSKNKSV